VNLTFKADNSGFSMIELMVTLALAAILLGMALPAFNGMMTQRTMTTQVNDLVVAVHYARSEAVKLGGLVTVQAVDESDSGNEWGPGYCVIVGDPGNCDNPLRVFTVADDVTLDATGILADEDSFSFNGRGLLTLDGNDGTFRLCSTDADTDPGRIVEINTIGRTTTRELVCNP
jgi:type IV fimbrial biogenesis protein FimT